MNVKLFAITFVLIVVVISGCIEQGTTPKKVGEMGEKATTTTIKPVQKFKIGDIVSNNVISIVVNSMAYKNFIDTGIAGFPYEPQEGNTFLILDVTVENVGKDTVHVNPFYTTVTDEDGYTYNFDGGITYLNPSFDAVDVQVGRKTRGKIAYQLPETAQPSEFIYDDMFRKPIMIELHN